MLIILAILLALPCGFFTAYLADKKGYSYGLWFVLGFFFNIVALITAAGLPLQSTNETNSRTLKKKCPRCAESINTFAQICRFCRHEFSEEQIEKVLISSLESSAVVDRIRAVKFLCNIKSTLSIPNILVTFERAVGETNYPSDVYGKLLEVIEGGLIEWGDLSVAQAIEKRLGSITVAGTINRYVCILGELQYPEHIPTLVNLLKEYSYLGSISIALSKFGELSIPYLEEAMNSGDASDQAVYKKVLKDISNSSKS